MCTGDITELSCGHPLVHIRQACAGGPCARPSGPGTRIAHLGDTCATCDPDFAASAIGRAYRRRQAELAAELAAGDAGRARDAMESLRRRTNAAIADARHRLLSAGEVEFPGVGGGNGGGGGAVAGFTSRWEGGKCVWEREGASPRAKAVVGVVPREENRQKQEQKQKPAANDPVEFLHRALEAERERQRVAKGGAPAAAAAEQKQGVAEEDEKPFWFRKFGPGRSPRALESAIQREVEVAVEVAVAEKQPLHPLRHKKKVASWLPTEEEMDQLSARLRDSASLEPSRRRGDRKGESAREPSKHHHRHHSQQDGEEADMWLCEADREAAAKIQGKSKKSRRSSRAVN